MEEQKYNNGSYLFAINYKKYHLVKVKVYVYKPEAKLYNVVFKNTGGDKDLFADLPETQLIAESELTQPELAFNIQGKPDGWDERQTGIYIFSTIEGFHIGSINFDGKWKDYNTDMFYDDVSHYLKIADYSDDSSDDEREDIMAYEMTILSKPIKVDAKKG